MNRGKYIQKAAMVMFMICAISGLAKASWATTYYVSPSGSNASNGTSSSTPYLTIQQALNTVRPGDTVNIMAGTYNESLAITTSGTSTGRITVQNYNGANVTINSGSSRSIYLSNKAAGYYTFSGLNITCTYHGAYSGTNTGVTQNIDFSSGNWWGYGAPLDNASATANPQYFVVQNCTIFGGIMIMGSYNTVTGCTMNGNGQWVDGIMETGIVCNHNTFTHNTGYNYTNRWYHGMSNISYDTVSYNTVYNCDYSGNGGAIDFDGAYIADYNCTCNYNTVYGGSSGTMNIAIQFENGINSTCIGNIIYKATNGIMFIQYGLGSGAAAIQEYRNTPANNNIYNNSIANCTVGLNLNQSIDNFIYNNSFYNCSYAIGCTTGGVDTTHYAGGQIIKNNIISTCPNGILQMVGSNPNTLSNNIFYNSKNTDGSTTGTNAITGNPNYVNPSATPPNLAIGVGSAAIKAGLSIPVVTTDILGNPRPVGSAYDIGAYQYGQVAAVQLSPPTGLTVQ